MHTCVYVDVCVHVCVRVCLCEMVTFDDGGGGDGQRRLSQRRRWHQRGPPRLWDCSKISDTPKGVMTVQKSTPPYYALLGCKCECNNTTDIDILRAITNRT